MGDALSKSFERPDDVVEFPLITTRIVELGDLTVGELRSEPGWRWSTHVRPTVGGDWCQARHVGFIISGRLGIDFADGTRVEFGPGDVFDIPPGHDGYTVGDEPCVQVEWQGISAWAGFPTGIHSRVLMTLLFTDLVDSTARAADLGDARWRHLLSGHFEATRAELERFGGRGVTVHEAARVMAAAGPGEILVSDLTRALAGASGLAFEDRGTHTLKGLDGEWRLAALASEPERLPS